MQEACNAWNGTSPTSRPFNEDPNLPRPQDTVSQLLERWNRKYFEPRSTLGVLCHEYMDLFPNSPSFAIYIVDVTCIDNETTLIAQRFGSVPQGLSRIDIFHRPGPNGRSTRRINGRTSLFSTQNPMDGRVHFSDRQESSNIIGTPQTQHTFAPNSSRIPHPHNPDFPIYVPSSNLNGGSLETLSSSEGRSSSGTHRTRSRSLSTTPSMNNLHRPSTPVQPMVVNPNQSQPNSMAPVPRRSASPSDLGSQVRPPRPISTGSLEDHSSRHGGYYYNPSTRRSVTGGPSRSPLVYTGPEPSSAYAWPSNQSQVSQRRRSRTLSHSRQALRNSNRFIPLPDASPDYSWSRRQSLVTHTPDTSRTVTLSALSDLDILMPPAIHNQWSEWTPGLYQYQPSSTRSPWSYEPRPELVDMVNDSVTQSEQPPTVRSSRMHATGVSQPQNLSTTQMSADQPPVADSALRLQLHTSLGVPAEGSAMRSSHEHLPNKLAQTSNRKDVDVRRRSTSRSVSRSPLREREIALLPADLVRSSSPVRVHSRRPSFIQTGTLESQQLNSMSNDEVSHRGRHHPPRSDETRVYLQGHADTTDRAGGSSSRQPDTVSNSISNIVTGPWTMDHLSLRTLLNPSLSGDGFLANHIEHRSGTSIHD